MTIDFLVALALLPITLWAPFTLFVFGLGNWRMNRRIKDDEGPHPDEVRNTRVIVGQFVPMSVANLLAGALAGIGGSLFVDGGHLRWPSSQAPFVLIVVALFLAEFTGIAIAVYVTRPMQAWVTDSSVFRSYLRQVKARGWVRESELVEIRTLRSKRLVSTNVRPLRDPGELRKLGLELSAAYEEWAPSARCDPVRFGARLCTDLNTKQVRRWITRKRLWILGVPPFVSGLALAGIFRGLIRLADLTTSLSLWLFVPFAFGCIVLLYWLAFRVGRLDLVMTNRYLALERAQLHECDQLIDQIEEQYRRDQANAQLVGADPSGGRVLLRIGRWDLCRRDDGLSARRQVEQTA